MGINRFLQNINNYVIHYCFFVNYKLQFNCKRCRSFYYCQIIWIQSISSLLYLLYTKNNTPSSDINSRSITLLGNPLSRTLWKVSNLSIKSAQGIHYWNVIFERHPILWASSSFFNMSKYCRYIFLSLKAFYYSR